MSKNNYHTIKCKWVFTVKSSETKKKIISIVHSLKSSIPFILSDPFVRVFLS